MPQRTVIVAAVEPSEASQHVTETAATMARILPGAELHFIHVIDLPPSRDTNVPMRELMAEARTYLDGVSADAARLTQATIRTHVGVGAPSKRIVQIAADLAADLLIVGTHDRHGFARILGSVSRRVFAGASCPVLVARAKKVEGADVPSIAPPCPDCLATQQRTHGQTLWCERHSARHVHGHLHYTDVKGFGDGSMLIRP